MSRPVANFPEPKEVGPREWGKEIMLCVASGKYTMKRIEMNKGAEGGLAYHHKKDEAGVVIYGSALVTTDDGNGNLVERTVDFGDVFHFPVGCIHKVKALTDFCYIEVSTPYLNDRVHCEHLYGLPEAGGLPSTRLEDVVTA